MNTNRAFNKSIRFLSRPIVPLLLGVLLINDHLLRQLWPSWWTGKLGDFAWLFVAPAILSIPLAWLIPARWKRHEKLTGLLAYSLTALAFILLKTIPTFRDSILQLWQSNLGFPAAVVIDPTDLLALVMLALSAVLWFRQKPVPVLLPLRGWLILPLFVLFTLADAAAPDYGIACLFLQDNQVIASARYNAFVSHNGGLTWTDSSSGNPLCESPRLENPILIDLPSAKLRSLTGARIEISPDGGNSWQVEYRLAAASEARDAYYLKTASGNPILKPGPLDAVLDPVSGNVIFAMGFQGVLVRSSNATYTWVSAGKYHQPDFSSPEAFLSVLGGELALAGGLVLLLLATWVGVTRKSGWLRLVFLIGNWLAWGTVSFFFSPAKHHSYDMQISGIILVVVLIWALPLGFDGLASFSHRRTLRVLFTAVAGGLIFLLPYILWYIDTIPVYTVAMISAAIFALIFAVGGFAQVGRLAKAAHPL